MRKKQLVVIGNGMGTSRLLDEMVLRGAATRFEITVFGEEKGGAYNRVLLGRVLAGESAESVVIKPPSWYERHGVRLIDGVKVVRLDTRRKQLETSGGDGHRYDVAVLATGSQPLVPPLLGMTDERGDLRPGIFVYRTMDDCMRMRERVHPGDSAIVVGGGLLGLESAKVLSDGGLHVTVVNVSQTLMRAQLDAAGGEMLRQRMERFGVFLRMGRTVESVFGEPQIEGVVLDDGAALPADLVVLACGVRPRVDLARASSIPVNKGIVVNDTLATEIPGVYAFGECAEHAGTLYGIVSPVWEQASVLADVLSGANPQARYRGSNVYTRLKVAGVEVASMGCTEPEHETDEVIQVLEERKQVYRKVIVRNNRLVGAMLVGNAAAAATLVQYFDRGDALPDDPLTLLCPAPAAAAPRERVVCNCNKVTQLAIRQAIEGGAHSVEAVGDACRAGTGCGSCKGEIAQLISVHARSAVTAVAS